ncbi:MAG: 4-alpha-glucanotransferase [Ignavibacteria bacterium]|nr:4-alpha-glucanotransferase [Ignavibacteria bacterium]
MLDVELKQFNKAISDLSAKYPPGGDRFNPAIKNAKIEVLKIIFSSAGRNSLKYLEFKETNMHWLRYYALFRVIADINKGKEWMEWDVMDKYLSPSNIQKITETKSDELEFCYWIQWQLFEQLSDVSAYAEKKGVLIMGDLPFLVSRNSADVGLQNLFQAAFCHPVRRRHVFCKKARSGECLRMTGATYAQIITAIFVQD